MVYYKQSTFEVYNLTSSNKKSLKLRPYKTEEKRKSKQKPIKALCEDINRIKFKWSGVIYLTNTIFNHYNLVEEQIQS